MMFLNISIKIVFVMKAFIGSSLSLYLAFVKYLHLWPCINPLTPRGKASKKLTEGFLETLCRILLTNDYNFCFSNVLVHIIYICFQFNGASAVTNVIGCKIPVRCTTFLYKRFDCLWMNTICVCMCHKTLYCQLTRLV